MLRKIVKEVVGYPNELSNDTERLENALLEVCTREAVDDMLGDLTKDAIIIAGKLFVRLEDAYYTEVARLVNNGRRLEWNPNIFTDLMLEEGITSQELQNRVVDIIISNDIATNY